MSFSWFKPNPLGILPRGNAFDAQDDAVGFSTGALRKLSVPQLEEIVSYLGVRSLSRLAATNWHWNALCNFPELWKQLFIIASNGKVNNDGNRSAAGAAAAAGANCCKDDRDWSILVSHLSNGRALSHETLFCANWKTFLVRHSLPAASPFSTSFVHAPSGPSNSRRSALCSDPHFQSWLCTCLPPDFTGKNKTSSSSKFRDVERRDIRSYTADEFRRDFEDPNEPCILTHVADDWPIFKIIDGDYDNISKKAEQFLREPQFRFRCESVLMSMKEYHAYSKQQQDERPIYMFDADFETKAFRPALWNLPEHFARDDLFALLGEEGRPQYRWLITGPRGAGSSFHQDPNRTSAINVPLCGRKRWICLPPDCVPAGVFPSDDFQNVRAPASITEWFFSFFDECVAKYGDKGYDFVCGPGECVFVPSGWWHCVINLDDSLAITQNYVSKSNLFDVLRFLRVMKSSISGIGEEEAEEEEQENAAASASCCAATRPGDAGCGSRVAARQENFHHDFAAVIKKRRPDLAAIVDKEEEDAMARKAEAEQRRQKRAEYLSLLSLVDDDKKKEAGAADESGNNNNGFSFGFM